MRCASTCWPSALEVTRGSFYWHFKDREALLTAVLNAWRVAATEQVIGRFEGQQADPSVLIGELISLPFAAAPRSVPRGSNWRSAPGHGATRWRGRRSTRSTRGACPTSRSASRHWASDRRGARRAFILYAYEVAESLLSTQGTAAQKRERSALLQRLVQTRLPPG